MNNSDFMKLAINEALKSSEPFKCGVVIVKDGKVISKAFNSQRAEHNSTAHAEIKTISEAGKILGDKNLYGCTVYGTCEPCSMCLSAMIFAKVERLVYGLNLSEVGPKVIDLDIDNILKSTSRKIEIQKNFMAEDCKVTLPNL